MVAQQIIRDEIAARGYTLIVLGDLNDYAPDIGEIWLPATDGSPEEPQGLRSEWAGPEFENVACKISRAFDRYTSHWDKNKNNIPDEGEPMSTMSHVLMHRDLMGKVRQVFINHGRVDSNSNHWAVVVEYARK